MGYSPDEQKALAEDIQDLGERFRVMKRLLEEQFGGNNDVTRKAMLVGLANALRAKTEQLAAEELDIVMGVELGNDEGPAKED